MNYKAKIINALDQMIRYEFPRIKGLEVMEGVRDNIMIVFYEGEYTQEEVEAKINEIRNTRIDFVEVKNVKGNSIPL